MSDSYPPLFDSILPESQIGNDPPMQSTYSCYGVFSSNRLVAVRTTHAAAAEDAFQIGGRVIPCTLTPRSTSDVET